MRKSFISKDKRDAERGYDVAETRERAEDIASWACDIIETEGGWMAFESASDADIYRNQK